MSFTQNDLDSINKAIAQGNRRVSYADRTVEYRDMSELLQARDAIQRELRKAKGGNRRVWPMRGTGF